MCTIVYHVQLSFYLKSSLKSWLHDIISLQNIQGGAEVISGSHTITHVIDPLMILQFNNIVTNAIYGNSKGLSNCYTWGKAAAKIFSSNTLCNN